MHRIFQRFLHGSLVAVMLAWLGVVPGSAQDVAQELSALARLDPLASSVRDDGAGVSIVLSLSQPIPYRVMTLANPPRLVLDFREIDWSGVDTAALSSARRVLELRSGTFRQGWSRLVLELDGPYAVRQAGMDTAGASAVITVQIAPVSAEVFAANAGAARDPLWDFPKPAIVGGAKRRQTGDGPLVVVLDPGHGGIDPGAENGAHDEADLMLTFARELKEILIRSGGFTVVMTREEDLFVPLETRISLAHAAGADVFLSLHADAIAEGVATGATIYTLAEEASDAASAALAERHDRADLLAGVDLSGQDDLIAAVLMEMARVETSPRSDRLADALVTSIKAAKLDMHKRPRLFAAFSVLKSPDVPSVLLEIGFLSSPRDLANLTDSKWRARMAGSILVALQSWALADAAEAGLLRQ